MAAPDAQLDPFGLSPEEAIRWFREKGYRVTPGWEKTWSHEHARAFAVAKATQLDLLGDIRYAVDKAIADGQTLGSFRKGLEPTLQERGWWDDGSDERRGLGSPRRLRTIYETNLRQARSAGQWERIQRVAVARPFLRYVAITDGRGRHEKWHGTVLPHDDPWWETRMPPNGWGCRCKVQQLSARDLERYGFEPSAEAPPGEADPTFAYNPGEVRGFRGADGDAPALDPGDDPTIRRFDELGRPAAKDITDRPLAPAAWPAARSKADEPALRERWRTLFGGDEGFVGDPLGDPILFNQHYLRHLLKKRYTEGVKGAARAGLVPLAKATVENPYEIWLEPSRNKDGEVWLRKKYIGVFDGADFVMVVERGADGYASYTSYARDAIDTKRTGHLLYPEGGA